MCLSLSFLTHLLIENLKYGHATQSMFINLQFLLQELFCQWRLYIKKLKFLWTYIVTYESEIPDFSILVWNW